MLEEITCTTQEAMWQETEFSAPHQQKKALVKNATGNHAP